jgi:hypothetical protein
MIMRELIFLLFILLFSGCINFDDELTITKTPFNGDNLKTNGYYYNIWRVKEETFVEINFLYRDGVLLHGGSDDSTSFSNLEKVYLDGIYYDNAKIRKYCWGSFVVEEDSIFIERWYPPSPYWAYRQSGIILNDSTYKLTKIIRVDGTEESEINRVFHFKQFSPKPDSTNNFIN